MSKHTAEIQHIEQSSNKWVDVTRVTFRSGEALVLQNTSIG